MVDNSKIKTIENMVKRQNISDVRNETDDVFEETAEHRIKTEKVHEECEDNFEILEIVEGSSSSNLNDGKFCDVSKRNNSSHIIKRPILSLGHKSCNVIKELYHKDVEIKSTKTGSCLSDEDPDDVFDEEREKGEKETARCGVGFERIITEIKVEIDEDNGTNNSQENLDLLANFIKQKNITDDYVYDDSTLQKSFNNLPVENLTTNKVVSTKQGEHHIKNEVPRIKSNILKNLLSLMKSSKQNDEKEVNRDIIIETTESGKKFKEADNANKATNNKQHSDRNNEQGENVNQSCHFDNAKQTEMKNKPSLKNISVNIDNSEKAVVATVVANKENYENNITESKKKNPTKTGQMETNVNIELQELSNKSVNTCCQSQTETLLEICSRNADEEPMELSKINMNYICKNCPYEAKSVTVMNKHYLLKHDVGFSSTITSFFDVIKKAKLYTSQLEQIYDEKELGTPIVIENNEHENEGIYNDRTNTNVNSGDQFETEDSGDGLDNTLQIENVDICANVPLRMQNIKSNYTSVNERRDEVMNTENENLLQSKGTFAVKSKKKVIGKPIEGNCFSESDQSVKDDEVEVNSESNPSLNVEYSCAKCTFKTKHRALLRRHLVTHGNELASGIITFLDLVENNKVFPVHFKEDSEVKEEQTQIIREDIETESEVDILDIEIQSTIDCDAQSRYEKKLENEGKSCKISLFDEGTLPINNTIATNVDKSENIKNIVNENKRVEIPGKNKAKLKLRKKRKRKGAVRRTSLPIKKIKVDVNDEKMYCRDECSYQSNNRKNFNAHKIIHSKNIKCDQY